MLEELLSAFVLLTFVVDPFGNLPIVNALLAKVAPERRRRVILRECLLAYLLLLAFMFGGQNLLALMRLSQLALTIAGGVILFLIALRMVFRGPEAIFGESPAGEPFIVPLAIPFIAGPSAIATVMLLASRDPQASWKLALALTVAMLVTAAVLAAGESIQRVIGQRAVEAIQRLMGLILTAIAVQMLLDGIRQFIHG